jgi:hypothetical protein
MNSIPIPAIPEAAAGLVAIDAAGQLPELNDEIICVRREWHKCHLQRTVGENIYIDQLAKYLQADGIDAAEAWNAVRDAMRPSWAATLLQTIVEFARRMEPAEVTDG